MLRFVYHAGHMHRERPLVPPTTTDVWYLVLCGDLGVARFEPGRGRSHVQFGDMLTSIVEAGWAKVFYVPGPREFAGSEYRTVLRELRALADELDGRLAILADESVAHVDAATGVQLWVTGSTLWTDEVHVPAGQELGILRAARRSTRPPSATTAQQTPDDTSGSSGELPEDGVFFIEDVVAPTAEPARGSARVLRSVDKAWWQRRHRKACDALLEGLVAQPPGSLGIVVTHHLPASALAKCRKRSEWAASDDVLLKPHLGRTRVWFHACAPRDGLRQHLAIADGGRFATLTTEKRRRLLTFCGANQYEHDRQRRPLNTYRLHVRRDSLEDHRHVQSQYTADAFRETRARANPTH